MAETEIPGESPSSEDTMTTIDILDTSDCSLQYLFGNREAYLNLVVPLYEASITGDWETAKIIFDKHRDLVGYGLSENLGTALHVAVTAKVTKQTSHFVKNLVKMMTEKELELQNKHCNTAFIIACACGNIKAAKIMMKKNHNLLNIHGCNGHLPLSFSALTGKYKVVKYLYSHCMKMTGNHWTYYLRCFTLMHCVERGFFDVALQIVDDCPELVDQSVCILEVLARKTDALNRVEMNFITRTLELVFRFVRIKVQPVAKEDANALELLKRTWGHATSTMSLSDIEDMLTRSSRMLFIAAEMGNTRFIVELLRTYPDLMLIKDEHQDSKFYGLTIFHIAVMRRHQGIYNLLHEIGESSNDICICVDNTENNNMLHLVGKSSKEMAAKTSGASLLMQRELLWFKEVEKIMPPYLREATNQAGQTPYELFYKENEDLVSKELKWMKDCMVVATLIVTIAFAVAFTVPGGYNQDHGLPIFIHHCDFLVFVIADAISLFSSSTSLLVFLSVLTSRHDQRDFMYSLPRKLMIGLLTLLVSVAAMMVTFSASFFVLYHKGLKWVPILIAAFATVPVIVFAVLQFPLLVDMFRSMHDSHYLFNPKKRRLYTRKPRLCYNNSACWQFRYKTIIKRISFKKC